MQAKINKQRPDPLDRPPVVAGSGNPAPHTVRFFETDGSSLDLLWSTSRVTHFRSPSVRVVELASVPEELRVHLLSEARVLRQRKAAHGRAECVRVGGQIVASKLYEPETGGAYDSESKPPAGPGVRYRTLRISNPANDPARHDVSAIAATWGTREKIDTFTDRDAL